MSKTAIKYFGNYRCARRKTWLERVLDRLRNFQDWYCGVKAE